VRKLIVGGLLVAGVLAACASPAASNDTAELQRQVAALQTQVAALEREHAEASPFDVAVAQYVLNTAGFHAMSEALAETQTIDPSDGGIVTRVQTVLAHTTWPTELQAEETALMALLDQFSAKIEADDGAGAVEISDQVHEAQHAFSESIDGWLGAASQHRHED
jgi:hypothetical protein